MKPLVAIVPSAVLLLCGPPAARADERITGRHACAVPNVGSAICFRFAVPENRALPGGRAVRLNVVYFPARAGAQPGDAVAVLDGGPGEGSAADAGYYFTAAETQHILRRHALLFVDSRGTGFSSAIECPLPARDAQAYLQADLPLLPPQEIRRCRARLAARADLSRYNTVEAVDDLDAVRAALGLRRLTLFGTSGGTLTAQIYLRRHPASVRAMVLGGVESTDNRHPAPTARARQYALDEVFRACAADRRCGAAFPRLAADLRAALGRLAAAPARARLVDGGRSTEVEIDRAVFADRLGFMLYGAAGARNVPHVVHEAAAGRWAPFAAAALQVSRSLYAPAPHGISKGFYYSSVCAEGVPFIRARDVAQTAGTFIGDERVRAYRRACAIWNVPPAAPSFPAPVRSSVPTLIVSGKFDPTTPWWVARGMMPYLRNGYQIVDLATGHLDDWDCFKRMIIPYIDTLDRRSVDATCARSPAKLQFTI